LVLEAQLILASEEDLKDKQKLKDLIEVIKDVAKKTEFRI
jgi:hypothetical protein